MTAQIVQLTESDGTDVIQLAASVGWKISAQQMNGLLVVGKMYGFRMDGQLIATVGVFSYGLDLKSIGMVMVNPDYQRRGLATELLNAVLDSSAESSTPEVLIATEQGFGVYRKVGYTHTENIYRLAFANRPDQGVDEAHVDLFRKSHLNAVLRLDRQAVGADRRRLFHWLLDTSEMGYVKVDVTGEVIGFVFVVRRGESFILGPLVAPNTKVAVDLVRASMAAIDERPLRMDVPAAQQQFLQAVSDLGFAQQMISPLMIRHTNQLPGQRHRLYAIADPAFG